eukprot:TRINITY_DN13136_c0_g1_i1.p1 TRINITY_DN13136_c0_g1~~TRINITY_DN13136_c0_g1_i1.p1  ORF type:complete len:202 (-),score=6.45 TRINITY_DN13136_c0_g1_i1:1-606(-)
MSKRAITICYLLFSFFSFSSLNLIESNISPQPCKQTSNCRCTNLWDSDCDCQYYSIWSKTNFTGSSACGQKCFEICRETWQPHSIDFYNLNSPCPMPKIKRYSVHVFINSKCKEGVSAINHFKEVLEVLWDHIDFHIVYLSKRVIKNNTEQQGDKYELCAVKYYPKYEQYFPFLYCLNTDYQKIPANVKNCSIMHLSLIHI